LPATDKDFKAPKNQVRDAAGEDYIRLDAPGFLDCPFLENF